MSFSSKSHRTRSGSLLLFSIAMALCAVVPAIAEAKHDGNGIRLKFHFQQTLIDQANNNFRSPYAGKNSFLSKEPPAMSLLSNFKFNLSLPDQFSVYFNPDLAGGKALSNTLGLAAFPNGDIYRVAAPTPVFSSGEIYLKKTFSLSGTPYSTNGTRLSIIAGKFCLADFFDRNEYSNDPNTQFMNWALMNNGAWDYAADTRGYIPGFVAEYLSPIFTLRFAATMQTSSANGPRFDPNIAKAHSFNLQGGYAYSLEGLPGKVRLLLYYNTGHFGNYAQATNDPQYHHNIALTRQYGRTKVGFGVNIQQSLCRNAGLFARIGWNDGQNESWSYTEIDRTVSVGILTKPHLFGRRHDTFGIGAAVDGISKAHRDYLASGGYGFIIGDGKLPQYGPEELLETFYKFQFNKMLALSADYQYIVNPAYNPQRGPVNVFGLRAHVSL